MTLEPAELAQVVKIIDGIDAGKPAPRLRGLIGQFLRTRQHTRLEVPQVLAREGLRVRKAGWLPGSELGAVELTLLAELRGSVPTDLWGPVEHAPVLSEELGGVADVTLWTSARSANRAHVLAAVGGALQLVGDYRWFPPGRLTTGDARVELSEGPRVDWRCARFAKATADDVGIEPYPLEYILDFRLGPPALKAFRVFAGRHDADGTFAVLPGLGGSARRVELHAAAVDRPPKADTTVLVFAYREPWNRVWHAIDFQPVSAAECVAHALTWADFRAELSGAGRLTATDATAVRDASVAAGLVPPDLVECLDLGQFDRRLLPAARAVTRWLRERR